MRPCRTAVEPLLDKSETEGLSGVVPQTVSERAVRHYCRNEWAHSLEDVMIRRTYWRYYHTNHEQIARRILPWVADELGWDDEKTQAELNQYLQKHSSKQGE